MACDPISLLKLAWPRMAFAQLSELLVILQYVVALWVRFRQVGRTTYWGGIVSTPFYYAFFPKTDGKKSFLTFCRGGVCPRQRPKLFARITRAIPDGASIPWRVDG